MSKIHQLCAAAVIVVGVQPAFGNNPTHTIHIANASPAAERVVSIGSWYEFSDIAGWTFRPETDIDHVEFALYDSITALAAGTTPFDHHRARTSGLWPDGPENELGELGYEVSPNVLGDSNQHLYGEPHHQSITLYGGHLSPDGVYQISFADSAPSRIWLHPLRSHYFTMSADILQSSESTLTNPVYGPASISRTILNADSTRFEYSGLSPDIATGLKDDYPVGSYDQRPGSHGSGDFGWFPGYSLSFHNEGPGSVAVALFVTTGFTGPSGAPSNTLANDTFWKSDEVFISMGDSATAKLDFDNVQGYSLSDNPFPHTAGDQSVPDGTAGVAINTFDRLQVSAIGWEVRSGGGPADASLIITPRGATVGQDPVGVESNPELPMEFRFFQNVPNPFNPMTQIAYHVPHESGVSIRIYDVSGRLVRTLVDGVRQPGRHLTVWNGRDGQGRRVAAGVYFCVAEAVGESATRKIVLLR